MSSSGDSDVSGGCWRSSLRVEGWRLDRDNEADVYSIPACFKIGSDYIAQPGLKLWILLPKCHSYRYEPPHWLDPLLMVVAFCVHWVSNTRHQVRNFKTLDWVLSSQ